MRSLNLHIKINKLLDYSKEIKTKNNKLPKVIIIFDDNKFEEKKFLKNIIYSLETHSSHPLANAIKNHRIYQHYLLLIICFQL